MFIFFMLAVEPGALFILSMYYIIKLYPQPEYILLNAL